MKTWTMHHAKVHFSAVLATCETSGPQLITKRGTPAAVLVPIAEWHRLNAKKPLTLKELLLSNKHPRGALNRIPTPENF